MVSEVSPEGSQWNRVWLRLRRHRLAICALCVLSVIVLLVLLGPIISPILTTKYDFVSDYRNLL